MNQDIPRRESEGAGIRIACFSQRGEELAQALEMGSVTRFPGSLSLSEWTGAGFREAEALLYVGACQIAVRSIAPYIKSKLEDPAVVVMDETGACVIPILSGHLGGANDLAERIAEKTGAYPVITTATDRRHAFAPDSWARENGFGVVNPEAVKTVSAAVLEGEEIVLTVRRRAEKTESERNLRLVPRRNVIGAGCRRGTDPGQLENCFYRFCERHSIEPASVLCLASLDRKREEAALRLLAGKLRVPFLTYSAQELMGVEGSFTSSAFVREMTGTDNVCERAAVKAALEADRQKTVHSGHQTEAGEAVGSGHQAEAENAAPDCETETCLTVRKEAFEGITFAAARVRTVKSWAWTGGRQPKEDRLI